MKIITGIKLHILAVFSSVRKILSVPFVFLGFSSLDLGTIVGGEKTTEGIKAVLEEAGFVHTEPTELYKKLNNLK